MDSLLKACLHARITTGITTGHNGDTQLCALESDQPGYTGSEQTMPSTLVDDRDYCASTP